MLMCLLWLNFLCLIEAWCGSGGNVLDMRLSRTDSNTSREMRRFDFNQLRNHLAAYVNRVRATSVKTTTRRRIYRGRHVAFQHDTLPCRFHLRIGTGTAEISAFV